MLQAEAKMVAMGIEVPVEVDIILQQIGEYCMRLDDDALQTSITRRHLEAKLRKALEAHSTFLVGAFHDVSWDWASGRFNETPTAAQMYSIGEACSEWSESRHRGKVTVESVEAELAKAEAARLLAKETAQKEEEARAAACEALPAAGAGGEQLGYGGIFESAGKDGVRRHFDFGEVEGLDSDSKDADVHATATIDVSAGSSRDLPIIIGAVSAAGAMIEWRFRVDRGEQGQSTASWIYGGGATDQIGHCAFYLAGVHDERSLYGAKAVQKVDEVVGTCSNRVRALRVRLRGTLLLRFDNTAAWMGTKRIRLEWSIRQQEADSSPTSSPRTPRPAPSRQSPSPTLEAERDAPSLEAAARCGGGFADRHQASPGSEDAAIAAAVARKAEAASTSSDSASAASSPEGGTCGPAHSQTSDDETGDDVATALCVEPTNAAMTGSPGMGVPRMIEPQLLGRLLSRNQSAPGSYGSSPLPATTSAGTPKHCANGCSPCWWREWRRQIRVTAGSSQDIAVPLLVVGSGAGRRSVALKWSWAGLEYGDSVGFSALLLRVGKDHPMWAKANP